MAAGRNTTDIRQGAVFRLDAGPSSGAEISGVRPWVVLQNDLLNSSRIGTILAAPMTTNVARAGLLGNVLLEIGEGGTLRRSAVNASQTRAVDRGRFVDQLGQLSDRRVREIIAGLNLLLTPRG